MCMITIYCGVKYRDKDENKEEHFAFDERVLDFVVNIEIRRPATVCMCLNNRTNL